MNAPPKIVAIDANIIVAAVGPDCDRKTRVLHLLDQLDRQKGKLIIPTPALAEYLVHADQAGLATVNALQRRASVKVASFDLAAAFEASQMDAAALGRGNKRDGGDAAWQKVKIDRQIVAVAKVHSARLIVSDDDGVRKVAARLGIDVMSVDGLPFPDSERQTPLPIPPR